MSKELNSKRVLYDVEKMFSDPKVYAVNKPYPVQLSYQDVSFWQRRLEDDRLVSSLRRYRARKYHDFSFLNHGTDLVELVKERFLPIPGQSLNARVEIELSRREMSLLTQLFSVSLDEKQSGHIAEELPYAHIVELRRAFHRGVQKKDHPSRIRDIINTFFKK
ncbi:MAG TPA: hypothetical protein PKA38_04960 [Candidatus Levybacteria bacterium]|nr:hypothetical protein [Candidatus Levybacteria bacterium]